MLIICRTPVRISFFGGGTDYPDYYQHHPGAVLGTTVDKYTHVSVNTHSGFFDHKIRIGYSKTELVSEVSEIEHPSIRECLKFQGIDSNLDIHIFSDLPARTGLGSSSAFTVGFLNALYALQGKRISKQQLAEESIYIEQQLIAEGVGSQDQLHAAFGGFNLIEFSESQIQVKPLVISGEKLNALQKHLMIFYTGLTRNASTILDEQIGKTKDQSNDVFLQRMHAMVYEAEEMISSLPQEKMVKEFGKLLGKSWELKKRLSSKVCNPIIHSAYQKALDAGAYGGKLCGAGSGGFLALVVPFDKQVQVRESLSDFMEVAFCFENTGSTIIYMKD